jgi:hypothetical protein
LGGFKTYKEIECGRQEKIENILWQKEKGPKIITDQHETQERTFLSVRGGFSETQKKKKRKKSGRPVERDGTM